MSIQFVSTIDKIINSWMTCARAYTVRRFGAHEFDVLTKRNLQCKVIINERDSTYSYLCLQLVKIPCPYILLCYSSSHMNINYYDLCSHLYTTMSYHQACEPQFYSVPDRRYWVESYDSPLLLLHERRKKGRSKSTRIVNVMNKSAGNRKGKYSMCKQYDHYKSTCLENQQRRTKSRYRLVCLICCLLTFFNYFTLVH